MAIGLWSLLSTEKDAVTFFHKKSILPQKPICTNGPMLNYTLENKYFGSAM